MRKEKLSVRVATSCAHCSDPLDLTIDSDLNVSVNQDTEPLAFIPEVDFFELKEPSITEVF